MKRIFFLLVLFNACAPHQDTPNPETLTNAVDSVEIAMWKPAMNVGDTISHSSFYEKIRQLLLPALDLEAEKRLRSQALLQHLTLTVDNLADIRLLQKMRDSTDRYITLNSEWKSNADSIFSHYKSYIIQTVDSLYPRDTNLQKTALPDLLRYELVVPLWRQRLDSIEITIVEKTRGLLTFFDSNSANIQINSTLHFARPEDASLYMQFRHDLDSLSSLEIALVKESQWGQ